MTTPTAPKMMLLPVVLTEHEKLALFDEVSLMLTEVEKLEAERKRLPEAIKALLASIHMKNHAKAAGVIEREVEVFEVAHAFSGRVSTYRVDTGAVVKERDMDPDERQLTLGAPAARAPDERTEEQRAAGTPEEAEAMRDSRIAEDLDVGDEGAGATPVAGEGAATADHRPAPAPGELASRPPPVRCYETGCRYYGQRHATPHELPEVAEAPPAPKKLLKAPKGAKGARAKKLKIQDARGNPLPPPAPPTGDFADDDELAF
jgi:hypothetical protein